jgi:hypothetical protein
VPSTRGKVLAGAGIGVLTRFVTPALVDEVVGQARAEVAVQVRAAGGEPCRPRSRLLPARLGVYFVLGLCLYSSMPYAAVLEQLLAGLGGALRAAGWQVPAVTALTRGRRRLGEGPFRLLFARLCSPLTAGREPWSHICGLLAMAWDGTTVKAAATAANIAAFGTAGGGSGSNRAHYPQLRLVMLIACGTRALAGAAFGPAQGKATGERALAGELLGHLHKGMLLLADRGFYSRALWEAAAGTGAHLLWRVQGNVLLPVTRVLPDGSWLTVLPDPAEAHRRSVRNAHRRRRGSKLPPETGPLPGITARVIEFTVTVTTEDGTARTERYRLITTLLDHQGYPAATLAAGYARRWGIEIMIREIKTTLRSSRRILRGRTPDLARQELWATLVTYQAIRAIISLACASTRQDPGRASFTAAVHAVRATLTAARTSPGTALADVETAILRDLNPRRDGRICLRALTEPSSLFKPRNKCTGPISQHADYTVTIHHPGHSTPDPTSQPQHPADTTNQPP